MLGLFIIVILVFIVIYFWSNKIVFRFDTLFKKGFKLIKDSYGIYTWVGKQGDGKTFSVISWLFDRIKRDNMKVITNVKSFYENNKNFCIYEPDFYNIIYKFENGIFERDYIIFYDELFTMLDKGKLNKDILSFISQLRKRGIYLVTTVQEWLDINVTFRRYCRYYVDCKMYSKFGCAWSVNVIHDGYEMKWNNDINEYESPVLKTTIKKCSKAVADSYDTYEVIDTNPEPIIYDSSKRGWRKRAYSRALQRSYS